MIEIMFIIKAGVDLDKTIFDCNSPLYNFLNRIKFNKKDKLKYHEVDRDAVCKQSVFNKVFKLLNPNYFFALPEAVETINGLSNIGFEFHLVSDRPYIKPIIALTLASLQSHNIKYAKLILGCSNKAEYAKEKGLDYFIDNKEEICQLLAQRTGVSVVRVEADVKKANKNVPTDYLELFGFNERHKKILKSSNNNGLKRSTNVQVFSSWSSIGEYLKEEQRRKFGVSILREIFKKYDAKNFIAKGLCLPAPQKEK